MSAEKITKDKIITAVLNVAFTKSASGTSMAEIASELGIKKASLYNHFSSRDAIFQAVCDFCGTILKANPYIPHDYEAVVQKYSAANVLKGVVHRYIKVYEKDIPLRVMMFIESEKYFNQQAFAIFSEEQEKIDMQTRVLVDALVQVGKLAPAEDGNDSAIFLLLQTFQAFTTDSLLAVKHLAGAADEVRHAETARRFLLIDSHVDNFCRRLGAMPE